MAWRGQAALARPTPIGASGAALGGPHGAVDYPSGPKGQQPLVFPQACGPPGEGRERLSGQGSRCGAAMRVCHVAHPLTRGSSPAWAETPARWLGRRSRR